MQGALLLCCSSQVSASPSPASLYSSRPLTVPFSNREPRFPLAPSRVQLPWNSLHEYRRSISPVQSTATQEIVGAGKEVCGFVEIGFISGVHGLQGELSVKSNTDFPELRFCTGGRRWLRQQVSGRETIKEVELVEGREHPGKKSWILRFSGIDTVDQAKQLVGSTLLVGEEDRPQLEKGDFYTRDLVGMRVILKETGELVGTVVNVFNSGASDLLHVMLNSSNGGEKSDATEVGASGPLVWVPFVEAIVPNIDLARQEMQITPPKGLLELNIRSDERSKKERRQLEWKERKKFQKRLIAAKKKLCELEQKHVFDGLRFGEKSQRSLLADQIVGVNSKLLQYALQNMEIPSKRWSATWLISGTEQVRSRLMIPETCLTSGKNKEKLGANYSLQERALHLVSGGKVAIVLDMSDSRRDPDVVDSNRIENLPLSSLHKLLCDDEWFVKVEYRESVPLALVCPADESQSVEKLFSANDYFGFDAKKVWFLEEEKLPVVSSFLEHNTHKILMKSPWEMLQSPVGSGGVISLLSSHGIVENLSQMDVEYIQICSINDGNVCGSSLLLGFVDSKEADIGFQNFKDAMKRLESFDMVFSMDLMKKVTRQIDKLQFGAIPKLNSHVEMVEKKWVDVVPSSPNSYELHCPIYSCLKACSLDKVCILEITE